ncbi:MAG: ATP synthase F1 subunit gamma [Alphaproteobacteria bacterium]|nr:ATP synthase F1 subunit gamma [Alphaproteobacteria bacterium]
MKSLKALRDQIKVVHTTQKVTSAMKMVAAVKFRKNYVRVNMIRPYAAKSVQMVDDLLSQEIDTEIQSVLHVGGKGKHLILIISSDRGLCGGYNSSIAKKVRKTAQDLVDDDKPFCLSFIGHKVFTILKRDYAPLMMNLFDDSPVTKGDFTLCLAKRLAEKLIDLLDQGAIGSASIIGAQLVNTMVQKVTEVPLVPFVSSDRENHPQNSDYIILEPKTSDLIQSVLIHNLTTQIYQALLENAACEQAARMTAMDSATRNADKMAQKLRLFYNRTRQARITNELMEIISGAETS